MNESSRSDRETHLPSVSPKICDLTLFADSTKTSTRVHDSSNCGKTLKAPINPLSFQSICFARSSFGFVSFSLLQWKWISLSLSRMTDCTLIMRQYWWRLSLAYRQQSRSIHDDRGFFFLSWHLTCKSAAIFHFHATFESMLGCDRGRWSSFTYSYAIRSSWRRVVRNFVDLQRKGGANQDK